MMSTDENKAVEKLESIKYLILTRMKKIIRENDVIMCTEYDEDIGEDSLEFFFLKDILFEIFPEMEKWICFVISIQWNGRVIKEIWNMKEEEIIYHIGGFYTDILPYTQKSLKDIEKIKEEQTINIEKDKEKNEG